jgi:predicted ATPase with chaperone activity
MDIHSPELPAPKAHGLSCGPDRCGQVPQLGEVSLALHGVRLLDERPECRRHVLKVLRQPLEDGVVTMARSSLSVTLCMLVLRL